MKPVLENTYTNLKLCSNCGNGFAPPHQNQRYCSIKCRNINQNRKLRNPPLPVKKCRICRNTFKPYSICSVFCSRKCYKINLNRIRLIPLSEKTCRICSQSYQPIRARQVVCSSQCQKINKKQTYAKYEKLFLQKPENREHKKQRHREYRRNNKEKLAKHHAEYYQKNKEKFAKYATKYYLKNKQRLEKYSRDYYQKHKAEEKERHKKWLATPRGRTISRNNTRKRKHRLKSLGKLDVDAWLAKCEKLDHICQICNIKLTQKTLTMDHIFPVSKGGTNNIDNLQPLCRSCNSKKHDKIILNSELSKY